MKGQRFASNSNDISDLVLCVIGTCELCKCSYGYTIRGDFEGERTAQERNAAVKDKETFIAQSSTLAFTSLLPSLQTTPFAKKITGSLHLTIHLSALQTVHVMSCLTA